jgi:integrase/recombinase XerD
MPNETEPHPRAGGRRNDNAPNVALMNATTDRTDVFEDWLATRGSVQTARAYRRIVGDFLRAAGKPIPEITIDDAAHYAATLWQQPIAKTSVATYMSALRSFVSYCQGRRIIPQAPIDVLKRPNVKGSWVGRYLSRDETEALIQGAGQVSPQAKLAVSTMFLTGIRVGELARAEWRHLYEDTEGLIGLTVCGKGDKTRAVAIRPDLWQLVVDDRCRRGLGLELDARDRSPLLESRLGTAYSTVGLWKLVRRAAIRAGIRKPLSPHWLRHTFGTLAARSGATAFQIQRDMGHAHLETSERYVHMSAALSDSVSFGLRINLS